MTERMGAVLLSALGIWEAGGWGMFALALNGLVMFGIGSFMLLKLLSKGVYASPERAWRQWERAPTAVRGMVGRIIRGGMASRSLAEVEHYFDGVRSDEISPFERDLRVMKVSVTAAPLLGLLGTVTGMLATFKALATGGGGDQTMGMIAGGISEALITTESGLVLALSGLAYQYVLTRQHARYGKLVEHIETLCMQELARRGELTGGG